MDYSYTSTNHRAAVPTLRQFHAGLWVFFLYATSAVYSVDKAGGAAGGGVDLYIAQILAATYVALLLSSMKMLKCGTLYRLFMGPVLWLMAYSVVAFFTVPASPDAAFTFVKSAQLLSVVLLAVAAGSVHTSSQENPLRLLELTYASLIICMILAWAVALARPELGTQIEIGKLQLGKIPFHYTTLGGMASVVATAFFVRLNDEGGKKNLLVFLFALFTLLATRARMSTFYVLLVIWAVLFAYRRWRWLLAYNAAGASLFIIGPVREAIIDFVYRQQSLETLMNLNGRITAWIWGIGKFWEHPFIGHGYYTGSRYLLAEGYLSLEIKQFHNDMVNILFNTGAVGLACVAAVYISSLLCARRIRKAGYKRVSLELIMVLFVIFSTGFVHSSIGWDAWYMMFVFVAAAVTASNYRRILGRYDRTGVA